MKIQCPDCGSRYQFDPGKATRDTVRIKCAKCANAFNITIPEKRIAAELPSEASPAEMTGPTILIVDDARFFRELIVDVLTPLSCTLLTAADGREALELVRSRRPALVILDLNLPGLDGFELMRQIRADPASGSVLLLAMSGVFRQEADVEQAREAGADEFTSKSFRPEQLQARVRRLLEKR